MAGPTDCGNDCLADLVDCFAEQLDAVYACTGGEECPPGGIAVGQCLADLPCVDGSPS